MIRRVSALLLLLLLLCSCAKPAAPEPYTTALAGELLASAAFEGSEMAPLDMDILSILYGIDSASITDGVYHMAVNTSASADELVILVLADEAAAQQAEEACKARQTAQIAVCEDYCPAAVPRLEGAVISRRGNTLLFVVGDPAVLSSFEGIG